MSTGEEEGEEETGNRGYRIENEMSSCFYFCCYFITQLLIFALALAIDLAFGDPPERLERFYPIVWISRLMYFFDRITKRGNANKERVLGVIYALLIAAIFTIPCLALLMLMLMSMSTAPYPYEVLYVILAVPVFKMTFTCLLYTSPSPRD